MPSRLIWFRVLSAADRAIYRKWSYVVAAIYVTAAIGVVAVALSSTPQPAANSPLLASARPHH